MTDQKLPDKIKCVILMWEESECGWGVRPDGCSVHINDDEMNKYVEKYWSTMPKNEVPYEYERPTRFN